MHKANMKKTLILLLLVLLTSCFAWDKSNEKNTFGEEPMELPSTEGQPNI